MITATTTQCHNCKAISARTGRDINCKHQQPKMPQHIIHPSGRTQMEGHRELTYTVIECEYNQGVVVTYDPNMCPACNTVIGEAAL